MDNWKRLVIKIGSNVLSHEEGILNREIMSSIVNQIVGLKREGIDIVMVSSGAVSAGRSLINLPENMNRITRRQILASTGQVELMSTYQHLFAAHNMKCAQVLATKEDFRDRIHFVNMKTCILALLRDQIVPIVNENDVISISELMFTDNDELAGLTASLIDADTFIILSNVDGVLQNHTQDQVIREIEPNDQEVLKYVSANKSSFGRGGMLTKIKICQNAANLGIRCFIANGETPDILMNIRRGIRPFSYFKPKKKKSALKKWMAYSGNTPIGNVKINRGAEKILCDPEITASLLAVGVTEVNGKFQRSELIEILNETGKRLGIGLAGHSSETIQKILGKSSNKPVIHYDYLLIER